MRLITSYVHFAMINQSSSHPVRGGQKIEDKQSNQTESCAGYWVGSHSCSSRLTAGGGCPFDKLPAEFLPDSSVQHIWCFSHFYMVWKLLNVRALLSCHMVHLHLEFKHFGWSSRCFFTAGNGDEEAELCCKADAFQTFQLECSRHSFSHILNGLMSPSNITTMNMCYNLMF